MMQAWADPLGCVWYAGRDRTGQDGTIFSCPSFGAPLAWDRTGQGGTKTMKNCPTLNPRPDLSHAWDKSGKDIFALITSKNYKNTNYKLKTNLQIRFSFHLHSLILSCSAPLSLSHTQQLQIHLDQGRVNSPLTPHQIVDGRRCCRRCYRLLLLPPLLPPLRKRVMIDLCDKKEAAPAVSLKLCQKKNSIFNFFNFSV